MDRELLLLGLLRHGGLHGYRLNEFINRDLAYCTDLKKPTAYHLLAKMEERGWIVVLNEQQDGNRPPRRIYQITPAGEAVFQQFLRENLAAFSLTRFTGDIGIAFMDDLPVAERAELLARRRAGLVAELEMLKSTPASAHQGSLALLVTHQIRHLTAELDWLDEIMAQLFAVPGQGD
ncbi:MAG: helix-turn-helix transcriptional regulator [Anaerolineae bacterium]|nr:helix-turn-helix transcriptional regulator [Anaerolineae bacterium]